jgi:hypothetical protein
MHFGATPACGAQYKSPWHWSPGSPQMSAAFFCVTEAQTEPLWPTSELQMSVPEQSASPVHGWSDC